jgi:hypothetical protein
MVAEWDKRFDILVGAEIQDSETQACLDSGIHDVLHGVDVVPDPEPKLSFMHSCLRISWRVIQTPFNRKFS